MKLEQTVESEEIFRPFTYILPGDSIDEYSDFSPSEERENIRRAYLLEEKGFAFRTNSMGMLDLNSPEVLIPSDEAKLEQTGDIGTVYYSQLSKRELNKQLLNPERRFFESYDYFKKLQDASFYMAMAEEYSKLFRKIV